MKVIRYATMRLFYYKKQTTIYCLFSGFSAFLLMLGFNLYNLQSAIYKQIQERLAFFGSSVTKESFPSLETVSRLYLTLIGSLLLLFGLFFLLFSWHALRQNRQELLNWRLNGFSRSKLYLFVFWQLLLPLLLCCSALLLWSIVFQRFYENLLQTINLSLLNFFELPDVHSMVTSVKGLSIPMDQETLFKIDFLNDFLLKDTLKSFIQTFASLGSLALVISLVQFILCHRRLRNRRFIHREIF
ncbi:MULTISPECIES: hypothetical protein [unclassified Enterococcus]|uniref:hypothetical protein n=1 Tax=unclassified Enterococcus TaxID=2608891 RepID=UPI0013ECE765|nr:MULTISPECIES: hypothetical protein [unclassified Enterococcus]